METTDGERRATEALRASGIAHEVTRHGRVSSLAEAAAARGVDPSQIVKSIVVRRGDDDYLFVLVPGDRTISWPRLRELLGVNRLSMPDAATARDVTGYERGTITPFGSLHPWPVVADARVDVRRLLEVIGVGAESLVPTLGEHAPAGLVDHLLVDQLEVELGSVERAAAFVDREFLTTLLAEGPVAAEKVMDEARGAGIAPITLKRAKRAVKVKAAKTGMRGGWEWSLP